MEIIGADLAAKYPGRWAGGRGGLGASSPPPVCPLCGAKDGACHPESKETVVTKRAAQTKQAAATPAPPGAPGAASALVPPGAADAVAPAQAPDAAAQAAADATAPTPAPAGAPQAAVPVPAGASGEIPDGFVVEADGAIVATRDHYVTWIPRGVINSSTVLAFHAGERLSRAAYDNRMRNYMDRQVIEFK